MPAVNESEAFVQAICRRSFLSLWSIENPAGPKKGKELADALVIVGGDLIVFSVKECHIKHSGDDDLDLSRWNREAVDGSVKQLRGVANSLERMTQVRRRDNPEVILKLPEVERRRVHFVAVALGGDERVVLGSAPHDFGFVHVFDREAFAVILHELDTVTDFVQYLQSKEEFASRAEVVMEGGEWDLLSIYLRNGRKFPRDLDGVMLTEGLWKQAVEEPEFKRRKDADKVSYAWDNLIEEFAGHLLGGTLLGNAPPEHVQHGLRYMVRENRLQRRLLGGAFANFLQGAWAGRAQSRTITSPSGVVYVFVVCPRSVSAEMRGYVLRGYCSILREANPDAPAVIGILTEKPDGDWRMTFALMMYESPLTDEVRSYAAVAREAGILRRTTPFGFRLKEFPDVE